MSISSEAIKNCFLRNVRKQLTGNSLKTVKQLSKSLKSFKSELFVAYLGKDWYEFAVLFLSAIEAKCPFVIIPPDERILPYVGKQCRNLLIVKSISWKKANTTVQVQKGVYVLPIQTLIQGQFPQWPFQIRTKIPEKVSCILYTSGTTNDPVGVMVDADSFVINAQDLSRNLSFQKCDIVAVCAPCFTSYGISLGLILPLTIGKPILTFDFEHPRLMLEQLCKVKNVVLVANPIVYKAMLHYPLLLKKISSRILFGFSSGDILSIVLKRKFSHYYGITLLDSYGTTETNGIAICNSTSNMIMNPLHSLELKLMGKDSKEVCMNGEGQLWVKGMKNMKGYFGNDNLTRKRMVDGWINTGDWAKIQDDGSIILMGREATMVRVNGMRVHAEMVENAIENIRGVREAIVFGVKDSLHGNILRANIVLEKNIMLSNSEIKRSLCCMLPRYMIPRKISFVSSITSNNGKKLRKQNNLSTNGGI